MNITSELKKLGFNDTQINVYVELLKFGKATVSELAQKTGLKRTSVYPVVTALKHADLVTEVKEDRKTYIMAHEPIALQNYVERQERTVKEALPTFFELYEHSLDKGNIKIYEGIDGYKHTIELGLKYNKEKKLRIIGDMENYSGWLRPSYINDIMERRIKKAITMHAITLKPVHTFDKKIQAIYDTNKDMQRMREIRELPGNDGPTKLITQFDDYVSIKSSKKEGYTMLIKSAEFANTFKLMHETLWTVAKKLQS
jgi:sugar-specific transcriptional regulator TrmB